ncbi:MAG: hypothetical protein HY897_17390 [Deltaproteobacteria bacterium]|nr:hypothetical protein [Deltaproteobacteria bacterium]
MFSRRQSGILFTLAILETVVIFSGGCLAVQTGRFDGQTYTNADLRLQFGDPASGWSLSETYRTKIAPGAVTTLAVFTSAKGIATGEYPLRQINLIHVGGPDADAKTRVERGEIPNITKGINIGKNKNGVAFQRTCQTSGVGAVCKFSFYTTTASMRMDIYIDAPHVSVESVIGGTIKIDETATKETMRIVDLVSGL